MQISNEAKIGGRKAVYGLTFKLDETALEAVDYFPAQKAHDAIVDQLERDGFFTLGNDVYFCEEPGGAMSFTIRVLNLFKTFAFANEIQFLHVFEIESWTDMTEQVKSACEDRKRMGLEMREE